MASSRTLQGLTAGRRKHCGLRLPESTLFTSLARYGARQDPIEHAVHVLDFTLEIAHCKIAQRAARRLGGQKLAGDLDVAWLAEQLTQDRATPTVVAMHHPPYRVGVAGMDAIGLPADQRAALDALLADAPNVLRVIAGHVHRSSFSSVGGVPASTASSVSFQLGLDLAGGTLRPAPEEPAAFAIHVLVDGDLVTHAHPVVRGA